MPIYKMQGKKDGLQKYRVRINYVDSFGVKKQIDQMAYGSEAAKTLEYTLMQEVKNKTQSFSSITVQELHDEYMAAKQYTVRETTLQKDKQIQRLHILPTMGNVHLSKLNTPVLQKWKLQIEKKPLQTAMKNNIYGSFRAMLNYAVKMDYLPANPLRKIDRFKDAYATKKEMDYYTADEFRSFITTARSQAEEKGFYEWHFYVFFNIAFFTGLRKGEIHALKWSDIDGATLHVRRSIAQKLKGGDRETPPKNKSSIRDLQLPLPLLKILNEHAARC